MLEIKNTKATPRTVKPKIDESLLINNPFEFMIPVRSFKSKADYISAKELKEGIVSKIHKLEEEHILEQEEFTKVYNRSAFRLNIFGMSEKARSLFLWLVYEVDSGKDYLWLNKQRYMFEANVSINTLKDAIKELGFNKIITPTFLNPEYYWINPTYFFNGNRINKYPNNLVTK
jgi:hypothetical protein